jgi:hypothetical protein
MKKKDLSKTLEEAMRRAKSLEALALQLCKELEESKMYGSPQLQGTKMPFPNCDLIPERDYECGSSPFECGSTKTYDCDASGQHEFFECGIFECPDKGPGVEFTCDPNRDFYCDTDFSCDDFVCDAGHGYFCDNDNECVSTFLCKSTTNTQCDGSTGNQYSDDDAPPGGTGTSGDFQCAVWTVSANFDCLGTFDCCTPSEFECGNEQDGKFSCGGTTWPDNFDCGSGTCEFKCGNTVRTDAYDCLGDDEYECHPPIYVATAVQLSSFTATAIAEGVSVKWSWHLLDIGNAGFNLYRKSEDSDDYKRINTSGLIVGDDFNFEYIDYTAESGHTYWYKLGAVDLDGKEEFFKPVMVNTGSTLSKFELLGSHPNPTTGSTTISYQMRARGRVELSVYDVQGKLVKKLVSRNEGPGTRKVKWSGLNERGSRVSAGVYYCKLRIGGWEGTTKITIIR